MNRATLTLAGLVFAGLAQAQYAADDASNSIYVVGQEYIQVGTPPGDQTGATNGLNGGFGFTKWLRGGYFGTGSAYGTSLITNVSSSFNMGAKQFGLQANYTFGFEGVDARRSVMADMTVGQVLKFSMMPGGNGAGDANTRGDMGFEIRSSSLSNPGRDIFSVNGSPGQNYRLIDVSGVQDSGVPVAPGVRVDVAVKTLGSDKFECTLTPWGGSPVTLTATSISSGRLIRTFQFYAFDSDGDFYVNNLAAYLPEATVSGNINLLGLSQDATFPIPVTIEIRNPGSTTPLETKTVQVAANGSYSFTTSLSGNRDITAKGSHWLRSLNASVALTTGSTTSNVNFTLTNGDVDGDNVVSVFDYILLSDAFDSTPSDAGWLAAADLDHDNVVSVFDYIILSDSFDVTGAD